ncbi:hypothetical protein BGW36DRAFT_41817 [Talaromyces proteolyticus]|uniref:Uncharacterized protein n=1 Tax=Talaromyces proteolyticus TaxID=1131652 RepID=A0AAD4KH87_9EURO|nr:uncharacterized protein BGW36DRAFT_41817 [Talaromyces proteolyticus]KAH8692104.1 hypothetical protein BGW36DRAFT_41817 [Talaromyces proteolyticus]
MGFPYYWWSPQDKAVYSLKDPLVVRNIFTTIYVVLNAGISLIGTYYLKRSAQRILLQKRNGKHRTVPVNHLVSWLTLGSFASYVKAVRKIPGGGFGLLMIWTGIFSLMHQYFTNSFISAVSLVNTCPFENGTITTYSTEPIVPATTWPVTRLVYEAYLAAQNNGGEFGIYDKINYNATLFWPQNEDILGAWDCTQEANGIISPSDWSSSNSLTSWIDSQPFFGLNYTWSQNGGSFVDTGAITGFLVWSASTATSNLEQSDLHAIILDAISGDSPLETSNYKCKLIPSPTHTDWVPPMMPASDTLGNWSDLAYGMMQNTAPESYGFLLQNILNGMTMISGSGNLANSVLPSGYHNTYYSCLQPGTHIGLANFVLLAALTTHILRSERFL